jgi:thiamine-monophosphate kinase
VGPGDDAAVLRPPPGRDLVFTTDTLAEGVHFERAWMEGADLGWKAAVQSLSDIAAMGAVPLAFCAALSMPPQTPQAWIDLFLQGLSEAAQVFDCPLSGGNLSRSPADRLSVTVSMLGTVEPAEVVLRTGAKAQDELVLTGWPGLAHTGLQVLLKDPSASGAGPLRLRRPRPCLGEMIFLRQALPVHAALDTSDSLSRSAALLAEASGLHALLDPSALPLHAELAQEAGEEVLAWALHGGEDFELLMAAPPGAAEAVSAEFLSRFSRPLTVVGHLGPEAGPGGLGFPGEFSHFAPRATL